MARYGRWLVSGSTTEVTEITEGEEEEDEEEADRIGRLAARRRACGGRMCGGGMERVTSF